MTITAHLLDLSIRPWKLGLGAVPALLFTGWMDGMFDVAVRLTVLYAVPVTLAAWTGGRRIGVAVAVAAALTQFAVDLMVAPERRVLALWNLLAGLLVYVGAAVLLSGLRARLAEAHQAARTDPLTGLLNVRAFRAAAEAELARCRRYDRPVSVALIDLDRFKQINDEHGHGAGDEILRATARHLEHATRASDFVARVGGDEFAVLLPEADAHAASAATAHLGSGTDAGPLHVDFSVGVASFDHPPSSVEELMAGADRAMYARKRPRP